MYPFGPPDPPDRLPPEPEQVEPEPEEDEYDEYDLFRHDKVLSWRAEELARAGMNPRQARALALDRRVDIHFVVHRLLKRGCDPAVAFDIAS